MITTLTLTVDPDTAKFIQEQPGVVDPSALINQLIHEDMTEKGIQLHPKTVNQIENDEVLQELELYLDEDTHAAG